MNSDEPVPDSLDAAIAEYLQLVDVGNPPDRDAFLAAHGKHANGLRSFFRDQDRIDHLADPNATLPPLGDGPGTSRVIRYVGDYELLEEIARGGMGVVFRSRQVSLDRIVAVKMILRGELSSPEDVRRFRAEAEAAAQLDHPNIVPIYEIGEHDGQQYFSMKLVDGGSLSQQLATLRKSVKDSTVLRMVVKQLASVARAVHYAHQHGILHRDLKPGNILLDSDKTPYVTDFGLAKRVEGDSQLTRSGAIVGTPSYMAPEQARAEKSLTTAVDVYALGAILYQALTGRPPFQADTPLDTILQVLEREPVRPVNCDRDLATIALKCLEKEPDKRYDSAAALTDELDRWQKGEPILARPAGVAERGWKWVKRRPLVAALMGTAALFLLTVAIGWPLVALREAKLRQDMLLAAGAAKTAQGERDVAQELATQIRSLQTVSLADRTLENDDVHRADELLESVNADQRCWEWHYIKRRCRADIRYSPPRSVRFAAGQIHVPFCCLLESPALGAYVRKVPAKDWLSASHDELVLWNPKTQAEIRSHPLTNGPIAVSARAIAVSTDGRFFATANADGASVELRDLQTGQIIAQLPKLEDVVFALAFNPTGERLAAICRNGRGAIWSTESHAIASRFEVPSRERMALYFGPDGKALATLGSGFKGPSEIVLFDTLTGRELRRLTDNDRWLALAFNPLGDRLAIGTPDSWFIRDVNTGKALQTVKRRENRSGEFLRSDTSWLYGAVEYLAFTPDGRMLITANRGSDRRDVKFHGGGQHCGTIRIWDIESGEQVLTLRGEIGEPFSVAVSVHGNRIAWTDGYFMPAVLDLTRFRSKSFINGETGNCRPAVSPDGRFIATSNGRMRIFDGTTRKLIREHGAVNMVNALGAAFSHNGRLIAGGTVHGSWQTPICEVESGREVVRLQTTSAPHQLAFSPDDRRVLVIDEHGSLAVFDATNGNLVFELKQESSGIGRIYCGAFNPDNRRLVLGGEPEGNHSDRGHGLITVWDTDTWTPIQKIRQIPRLITTVAVSHDGNRIAAAGGRLMSGGSWSPGMSHDVYVWEAETGSLVHELRGHTDDVNAVLFSRDDQRLFTASSDQTVKVWDVKLGLEVTTLRGSSGPLIGLALSRDNSTLVVGDCKQQKNGIWVYDAAPLSPVPDGRIAPLLEFASSGSPAKLQEALIPRARAAVDANFQPPSGSIFAARVVASPDLSLAVAISNGQKLQVVDVAAGKIRHELDGLPPEISTRGISPDGRKVAAAGGPSRKMQLVHNTKTNKLDPVFSGEDGPGIVKVWDAELGRELATFRGHAGPVGGIAFSPDGTVVATTSHVERKVRLWEIATAREIAAHDGEYTSPRFEPDGERLILTRIFQHEGKSQVETVFRRWRTGQVERTIRHPATGYCVLSQDGRSLVQVVAADPKDVGRFDVPYVIRLLDADTGNVQRTIQESAGRIEAVAFGPKAGQLTAVVGRRVLRVWDLNRGQPVATYDHGCNSGLAVAFSSDVRQLAILPNGSNRLSVWDVHMLPRLQESYR